MSGRGLGCLVHFLFTLGCGQARDPEASQDAIEVEDADSDADFVAFQNIGVFLPAARLHQLSRDGTKPDAIAYVDITIVWSESPHAEIGRTRIRHTYYNPEWSPCLDMIEGPLPFGSQWTLDKSFRDGTAPFKCCELGSIDVVGLGYPASVNPKHVEPGRLFLLAHIQIPDPAKHGIHSRADLAYRKVDLLVQAYDCKGTPFRPRRYCGIDDGPFYEFTSLDPTKRIVFIDDFYWHSLLPTGAIISHSFALPMRHGIPGTFPGCPGDVTATCGDDVCAWPEDEVNCIRDCNWVSEAPP